MYYTIKVGQKESQKLKRKVPKRQKSKNKKTPELYFTACHFEGKITLKITAA